MRFAHHSATTAFGHEKQGALGFAASLLTYKLVQIFWWLNLVSCDYVTFDVQSTKLEITQRTARTIVLRLLQ